MVKKEESNNKSAKQLTRPQIKFLRIHLTSLLLRRPKKLVEPNMNQFRCKVLHLYKLSLKPSRHKEAIELYTNKRLMIINNFSSSETTRIINSHVIIDKKISVDLTVIMAQTLMKEEVKMVEVVVMPQEVVEAVIMVLLESSNRQTKKNLKDKHPRKKNSKLKVKGQYHKQMLNFMTISQKNTIVCHQLSQTNLPIKMRLILFGTKCLQLCKDVLNKLPINNRYTHIFLVTN